LFGAFFDELVTFQLLFTNHIEFVSVFFGDLYFILEGPIQNAMFFHHLLDFLRKRGGIGVLLYDAVITLRTSVALSRMPRVVAPRLRH
jgi:hypothetical protein